MSREKRISEKKIERKLSVSEINERDKKYHPCYVSNNPDSPGSIRYLDDSEIRELIAMKYYVESTVDPDRKIEKVIEINNPNIMCDVCRVRDWWNRQEIIPANSRIYYVDGGQRTVCNDHYPLEAEIEKTEKLSSSQKIRCTLCSQENSSSKYFADRKIIYTNKVERSVCSDHWDNLNGSDENENENKVGYWWEKD